jgi:hypothetical protein
MYLGAGREQRVVLLFANGVAQNIEKAWPASATVELGRGIVERQVAGSAGENTLVMFVEQRAGLRSLGRFLTHHSIWFGCQSLLPFRFGFWDFEGLGRASPAPRQDREQGQSGQGEEMAAAHD